MVVSVRCVSEINEELELWNCAGHIFSLDALLNAFPDAKFVFTHRDPVKVSSSALSLIRTIRQLHTDKVDPAMIAAEWDPRLVEALKKTDEIRDERGLWGEKKAYDVLFNKLVKNPISEVEKVYEVLGLPLSEIAKKNMAQFLASNPKVMSVPNLSPLISIIYVFSYHFLRSLICLSKSLGKYNCGSKSHTTTHTHTHNNRHHIHRKHKP